jgi:phospholipase C
MSSSARRLTGPQPHSIKEKSARQVAAGGTIKVSANPATSLKTVVALGFIALTPEALAQSTGIDAIQHVIVIYQENWSFDGLYGKFPGADGIANAGTG